MSLLQLTKINNSEWYIPRSTYPHGAKGYRTQQFSPSRKSMRKCQELAFFMTELPVVQHYKYNMWKYFDKQYVYKQIVDIVLQCSPHDLLKSTLMLRVRGLS